MFGRRSCDPVRPLQAAELLTKMNPGPVVHNLRATLQSYEILLALPQDDGDNIIASVVVTGDGFIFVSKV